MFSMRVSLYQRRVPGRYVRRVRRLRHHPHQTLPTRVPQPGGLSARTSLQTHKRWSLITMSSPHWSVQGPGSEGMAGTGGFPARPQTSGHRSTSTARWTPSVSGAVRHSRAPSAMFSSTSRGGPTTSASETNQLLRRVTDLSPDDSQ